MAETSIEQYNGTAKSLLTSDGFKKRLGQVLPAHLTADRMARVAIAAMSKEPKLADCTPVSVMECMITCSQLGLEPDGYHAHLIPYKQTCTLVPDYKGLLRLVYNTGLVSRVYASKVCKGDLFRVSKGQIIDHNVDYSKERGEAFAYYCEITFKDGTTQAEIMTVDEINRTRARSASPNKGPWVTDYDEMAKKTVFKRLRKWVPMSASNKQEQEAISRVHQAINLDDEQYTIDSNPVAFRTDKSIDLMAAGLRERQRANKLTGGEK